MAIDQERIGDVFGDDTSFVHIHIVDVVHDIDAATLASICWLDDPHIFLAFMLFQLLVMIVKVAELVGKNVRVWAKVEGRFAKALLQTHYVKAKAVFTSDLI